MKADNDNVPSWVVYTLADSRTPDDVRYVGITSDAKKRLRSHIQIAAKGNLTHKSTWIRSVINAGGDIDMSVVIDGLQQEEAKAKEIELIAQYRAGCVRLTNLTDGGEGKTNCFPDDATRKKLSVAQRRLWSDPGHIEKMKVARASVWDDPEYRAKVRASIVALNENPEVRKKKSADSLANWKRPEYRDGLIAARLETWSSHEFRERHKAAMDEVIARPEYRELHRSNGRLSPPKRNNTSGFKGVSHHKPSGKWQAYIKIAERVENLGLYADAMAAALAYDRAAYAAWGDDCYLNFAHETKATA